MSPRTGRPPIESPLKHDIKVRVNDDIYDELLKYCEKSGKEKATVIREALIQFLSNQR